MTETEIREKLENLFLTKYDLLPTDYMSTTIIDSLEHWLLAMEIEDQLGIRINTLELLNIDFSKDNVDMFIFKFLRYYENNFKI